MYAALKGVTMPQGPYTIAEGIAVKSPGDITREVAGRLVDRIELVSESDIEHAIVVLLEIEKSVVEGAGAAGLAALLRAQEEGSDRYRGKRIGLVLTGGNIDPLMLGELIERGMVRAAAAGAHPRRPARPAGRAGARHQAHRRRPGQYHRGPPPARLHLAAGAQRGSGLRAADPGPRSHPGSDRGAQQRGFAASNHDH